MFVSSQNSVLMLFKDGALGKELELEEVMQVGSLYKETRELAPYPRLVRTQ